MNEWMKFIDDEPSLLHFADKQIKLARSLHIDRDQKAKSSQLGSFPPVHFLCGSIAFSSLINPHESASCNAMGTLFYWLVLITLRSTPYHVYRGYIFSVGSWLILINSTTSFSWCWKIHYDHFDVLKTSSNQRLWECVRRRNFNTDTLTDLPIWLSTSVYY